MSFVPVGKTSDIPDPGKKLVEMLETSPEITAVRMALGQDPARFGEPTPYAAGDSTG